MNIITISREFGSGGRELGKRLADHLGYDYYDSEIISAVANASGMDEKYVEKALENHGWRNYNVTYRSTIGSSAYQQSARVSLLLEQKHVIEQIALLGKNCVIVGRNADVILSQYQPLNLFVCAETEAKIKRCMERQAEGGQLSERELLRKMKQIDKQRAQTRAVLSGSEWGSRDAYHLTVNTTDWDLKDLTLAAAAFAEHYFGRKS